ncbi:sn-glycerol-3-phosphate ABC transporter ATP-binding protein UgpC [Ponticoccus sp. SC2-23]|uniref:ABC transporter ATP-binding protein n=1 Tax=Alexandriicola marinus TaxID=2081710 RepID=UPI000FDA2D6D|nr:sn-glycerol-3-phosphate ABC transporter ATP-binding protein UgpC [Alexandriicola marinus]MBM1221488.1 sn-glycerol-3-phosphate ABC transporter ATP-binding protein UgpC [Ponticoccus sp. SC6-9]MBM1226529.1 sn-glycerol-3-phosphate ABC transporter ATP-binding protein UgpC [Ponticoccus sp. SC6-15]MBM1230480.1 sn-glycerol-3-phosphate ABC transporter ATP-binding protein UgpC [Ponticoccus sp. SC6-38]MBM1235003.1 sn-glycerol-3-phosphate ABC transporter ATP-binding protein UgpC [Ponticoccus sp. SC6-45]
MADLRLKGLRKSYGSAEVIRGVDIDIEDGEFVVFVGPSGCGKSTLLRMIAGLEDITSGTLEIGGKRVNDAQPKERGVAMVFQSYAIFPHMSVRENMAFGLTIAGASKAEKEQKVAEAARILQMEHLLDRRPSQLSGGQRQRVAIGRAITRNPSVFLFDEPLSNLDAALRMDMRMEIGKLHSQLDTTMIYVTHDQVEAMTLADKIVVLKDGEVMQIGSPMELYHNPANLFVAGFLGAPSMNFLQVDVLDVQGEEAKVSNPSLEPIVVKTAGRPIEAGHKATLGVRPQHLRVSETGQLHGNVTLAERLGSETVADLRLDDGSKLIAAFAEDKILDVGQRLSLDFDSDAAHLFPVDG